MPVLRLAPHTDSNERATARRDGQSPMFTPQYSGVCAEVFFSSNPLTGSRSKHRSYLA